MKVNGKYIINIPIAKVFKYPDKRSNLETEFLPLNCNWITSNLLPKYDQKQSTFVEPYLPNYKIGIMHLAAGIWKDGKDMRVDKTIKIELDTLDKNKILKSLRYNT